MSDIVEKTLASFPKFLSETLLGGNTKNSRRAPSRGFQTFVKIVSNARSKTDEEHIVKKELSLLQQRLSQPDVTPLQQRDYLSRLVFSFMLGYDVSFCCIHAVKLAQQGVGLDKRMGYLASSLLLHEDHEMIVLLINTIQKDLKSSSFIDNCMALISASQLVNSETIPMLLPLVLEKLRHQRELVRVKAAMCLHKFFLKAPSMLQQSHDRLQQLVCDKDPVVINTALHIYVELVKRNPHQYQHLGESLVKILQQIISRTFPKMYDYHNIPLPWLQIQLLRVLTVLAAENDKLSGLLYPVIEELLQRSSVKDNMAFAILYECIIAITSIKPNPHLLQKASTFVARFLQSHSHNLRYLGIKALTALIVVCPEYAVSHQMAVVECLDEEDQAIQRKTMVLLHRMANAANVKAICTKLLEHLAKIQDSYFKGDIASQISDLAERYSPDTQWYVETMNSVLKLTADGSTHTHLLISNIMACLEKELNRHDRSEDLDKFLAKTYLDHVEEENNVESVVQLAAWVLGECSTGLQHIKPGRLMSSLTHHLSRFDVSDDAKSWILSCLTKLVAKQSVESSNMCRFLQSQKFNFSSSQLNQRVHELLEFAHHRENLKKVTFDKKQNGRRHKMFDFTLSFLDDFIAQSMETGSLPYMPRNIRVTEQNKSAESLLEGGDTYDSVYQQMTSAVYSESLKDSQRHDSFTSSNPSDPAAVSDITGQSRPNRDSTLQLKGVERVWGRDGIIASADCLSEMDQSLDTETGSVDSVQQSLSSKSNKEKVDDKTRKHQLAQALFEGVTAKTQEQSSQHSSPNTVESTNSSQCEGYSQRGTSSLCAASHDQLSQPKSDSSGWRALHQATLNQSDVDIMSHDQNHMTRGNSQCLKATPDHKMTFRSNQSDDDNLVTKPDSLGWRALHENSLQSGQSTTEELDHFGEQDNLFPDVEYSDQGAYSTAQTQWVENNQHELLFREELKYESASEDSRRQCNTDGMAENANRSIYDEFSYGISADFSAGDRTSSKDNGFAGEESKENEKVNRLNNEESRSHTDGSLYDDCFK